MSYVSSYFQLAHYRSIADRECLKLKELQDDIIVGMNGNVSDEDLYEADLRINP
jgi:20S proteasome alpha/beta subunit